MYNGNGELTKTFALPTITMEDCEYADGRFVFQERSGLGGNVVRSFPVTLEGKVRSPDFDGDGDVDLLDFARFQQGSEEADGIRSVAGSDRQVRDPGPIGPGVRTQRGRPAPGGSFFFPRECTWRI